MNTLGKNAFLNGIKTACSIVFPFISFAYCSRTLGADGLGAYSFGQSIIAYLLLIAGLGISNYAIREGAAIRDKKDAVDNFINQVFSINCIMTIVAYAILAVVLLNSSKIGMYKYIILIQSIQIVLTTLGADWINTIYEDYLYLAIRYIVIQAISIVVLVALVRDSSDIYIYTLISMLSNAGGNILNLGYLRRKGIRPRLVKHMDLKKHMGPIMVLFANSVASIIYLNADITILGFMTNDSVVGVYTVSSKIYTMIKTLINAVIMVTLPRFSYYLFNDKKDEYKIALGKVAEVLLVLTIPMIVGMYIEAEKILNLVAGSEYLGGTLVVKILSLAIFFAIGACFFSYSVLIPNKKEKYFMWSTIVAAIVNIGLNFVLIPSFGINAAAITTLIAEIIVFIITACLSRRIVTFKISYKNVTKIIIACLSVVLICVSFDRLPLAGNVILIMEMVISIICYFGVLLLLRYEVAMDFVKKMLKRQ